MILKFSGLAYLIKLSSLFSAYKYKFHSEKLKFDDAEKKCRQEGSHLVKIDSRNTYMEVLKYLHHLWVSLQNSL